MKKMDEIIVAKCVFAFVVVLLGVGFSMAPSRDASTSGDGYVHTEKVYNTIVPVEAPQKLLTAGPARTTHIDECVRRLHAEGMENKILSTDSNGPRKICAPDRAECIAAI